MIAYGLTENISNKLFCCKTSILLEWVCSSAVSNAAFTLLKHPKPCCSHKMLRFLFYHNLHAWSLRATGLLDSVEFTFTFVACNVAWNVAWICTSLKFNNHWSSGHRWIYLYFSCCNVACIFEQVFTTNLTWEMLACSVLDYRPKTTSQTIAQNY